MLSAKIALAALLCAVFYLGGAQGLSSGQYKIQLAGACDGNSVSYLAFKNRTCGSTAGPVIRNGESSMNWKKWTVTVVASLGDGSFRAKLSNYYKNGKVQCLGSIAVGNEDQCTGDSAAKVSLRTQGSTWLIIPVGSSGVYQIIAEDRDDDCSRYLGADCDASSTGLFEKDEGAQQWTFVPLDVPNPSPSPSPGQSPAPASAPSTEDIPAGQPGGINIVYNQGGKFFVTWYDSTAGTPEETYSFKCVKTGESCKNGDAVGTLVTGIKRGVQQGMVVDLPPALDLDCYIIAENKAGAVCSDHIPITTTVICPKGEYGETACDKCPAGKTTAYDGSASIDDCNICMEGYEGDGQTCNPCSLGFYKEEEGNDVACTACATTSSYWYGNDDRTTLGIGSVSEGECVCNAGWEGDGKSCTECATDYYKADAGDGKCIPCQNQWYAPFTGADTCYYQCFPAESTASLADGTTKAMKDLEIGDHVLAVNEKTGELVHSPVYMFFERHATAKGQYLKFQLEGVNTTLSVSPNHFVYRSKTSTSFKDAAIVHAASVNIGDIMWYTKDGAAKAKAAKVTSKEITTDFGKFAPHTLEGSIVVDGVVAYSAGDYTLPNGKFLSSFFGLSAKFYFATSYPIRVMYRMGLIHYTPVEMVQRSLVAAANRLAIVAHTIQKISA